MSTNQTTATPLSALAREHLQTVAALYDGDTSHPTSAACSYRRLLARYYNLLIPAEA